MASKDAQGKDAQSQGAIRQLVSSIIHKLLLPVRLLTSRFAIKAYLTSILFFFTALFLFALAILAYVFFYWTYIPRIGFSRTIYLQYDPIPVECKAHLAQISAYPPAGNQNPLFGFLGKDSSSDISSSLATRCASSPSPWGTAHISPELIGQQAYDVVVELRMPRTPSNLDAGNFMIDARLLSGPEPSITLPEFNDPFSPTSEGPTDTLTLAHSRRPAILPYRSPVLSLYETILSLPRATFGFATETSTLSIPLFTRVSFPRGKSRVPTAVHIQLQTPSGHQLRVYEAAVSFRARFSGLRYLMYNFRLATGSVFVGLFFAAEIVAAAVVYGALGAFLFSGPAEDKAQGRIKQEIDSDGGTMSDTERTFPSYGSQTPLRYERKIKEEPVEMLGPLTPGIEGEADDEDDEEADFVLEDTKWRDSGHGTSMDSGLERAAVRRRRSRGGSGGSLIRLDR